MSLILVLIAIALLVASGLAALAAFRSNRVALALGTGGAVLACALGAAGAGSALADCGCRGAIDLRLPWSLPIGQLHLGLDPLSAFFLVCIFLVSALAAIYGAGYLRSSAAERALAGPAFFFNVLVASMATVVLARDGVLFLMAWEVMSVSSFFLVTFDHHREHVRRAGITYLIASHIGVVFLFVLFAMLSQHAGSFDFDAVAAAGAPQLAGTIFLVALVGFGTKAGFWPVHVWLPDAHPAAPSHVSALMSGVMIKMGIYGLLRVIDFLGPAPMWWGALVITIGLVTGITGVLQSLAQYDLKRTLAYSSVENIGIIALGIGIGLLGKTYGRPDLAFLGFAGALLHTLNHGLFKGLLFQAAGSVLHGAGVRQLDQLGGLFKRMPTTGLAFLVGAVAISGLPPLNGFVGEWLIYVGAFRESAMLPASAAVFTVAAIAGLALIGGMAAATFVRAFGIAFLGEPRSPAAAAAHEANRPMRATMTVGALLCFVLGIFPQAALLVVARPASFLAHLAPDAGFDVGPLTPVMRTALVLVALVVGLALLRRVLLHRRDIREAPTWGCGYAAPTARMQYTATSFSGPILEPFSVIVPRDAKLQGMQGYFPASARLDERVGDFAGERMLVPAARRVLGVMGRMRFIQHGKLHLYLVYVLLTLIVLLAWQLAA